MQTEAQLQVLVGTLERMTFQNEENGYTIAKLVPKGKSYEVTVVGSLAGVNVGELLRLQGLWITHAKYGRQFEVRSFAVKLPATLEGIRKYLGSGLVKGIGPVNAGRIVDYFGLRTLDVIEADANLLREVPGIGKKRAAQITTAWEEQKQIKEIMIFLQGYGVSTSLAIKIYKFYGDAAAKVLKENPYQLEKDIYGIGFKTADKIARQMGFAMDDPARLRAGLRFVLGTFSENGHCFAVRNALLSAALELLEVPPDACHAQLDWLIAAEELISEPLTGELASKGDAVYLPPFYYAELGVANRLRSLQAGAQERLPSFCDLDWAAAFEDLATRTDFSLAEQQQVAVRMALQEKVSLLTGGPGTGKTTITHCIIQMLQAYGHTVLLAAPTGRAAKRLSEATGLEAKTIHRLLEFKPTAGNLFLRDKDNPLDADMIVVDEVSMLDVLLMNHLLKAVEAGSHLLLVGDVDQLPSVGPGNVLRDMIASDVLPVTRLDTIFRQAADSYIIVNAHRINRGESPQFSKGVSDFFFFKQPDPQAAADLLLDIVARRVPQKFGFDAERDIQVLSPMHRGVVGVGALNQQLQAQLNPPLANKPEIKLGPRTFRVGDRVMQIRNDYERKVFNGDMGRVLSVDLEEHALVVDFEGLPVHYEFVHLDDLLHSYAISIHKSQGSEFPVVVIPLLMQHYMMLQRNLLYTGVTRARSLVVLVGDPRALAMAVRNNKIACRNTRLAERLQTAEPTITPPKVKNTQLEFFSYD